MKRDAGLLALTIVLVISAAFIGGICALAMQDRGRSSWAAPCQGGRP